MVTPDKSVVRFVFLLIFINIVSYCCMKLEAMNVVGLPCHIDNNYPLFIQIVVTNMLTLLFKYPHSFINNNLTQKHLELSRDSCKD